MNKCILVPDSFKGTMSATKICTIIRDRIAAIFPDCQIISIPVADGGEGTVDCFLNSQTHFERITAEITGPYLEPICGYYARKENTAVIEMAQAAGLPLAENNKNPAKTTTYGVGLLIRHALEQGCKKIAIGLGGSCTNDGGAGMAAALGTRFLNRFGEAFIPTGDTLCEISEIDNRQTQKLLKDCEIVAMCDVDCPLYGPQGAAYIFAPQKGADIKMVQLLDQNLKIYAGLLQQQLNKDVSQLSGAGAAGGMGAGIAAFLNGMLQLGIETILDFIDFNQLLPQTDLIFTGEGKIDGQSLHGKVISGVANRAKAFGIPVIAIVGDVGEDARQAYDLGVTAIFSINQTAIPFSEACFRCEQDLRNTVENLLRFWKSAQSNAR